MGLLLDVTEEGPDDGFEDQQDVTAQYEVSAGSGSKAAVVAVAAVMVTYVTVQYEVSGSSGSRGSSGSSGSGGKICHGAVRSKRQ